MLLISSLAFAQQGADRITGKWETENGRALVQIYKAGNGTYQGKILKTSPKYGSDESLYDDKNPDPSKRKRPIIGLVILRNLKSDGELWNGGKVYDPERGKEYDCKAWLEDNRTLKIRGYVGISLLGQTETWQRAE
jgi:uncharacterized protein (DUF2147 family)